MSKKRKLNSKNPKYWDKSKLNEKVIKKKVLYCESKGCKVYGVWYEQFPSRKPQVNKRGKGGNVREYECDIMTR